MPNEISVGDLVALLKLDKTQYDAAMVAAGKTAEKSSTTFVDQFKKIATAIAAAFSVKAIIQFVSGSVKEYLKAEEAMTKLNAALRSTGGFSTKASRDLADLASQLQQVTRFGDEASKEALALMMSLGGMTAKMASDVLPTLQDFAAGMGMDLSSAAMIFSKAMEGSVGVLGRYGIQIDEGLKGQEKLAAITDQMREKFGGLARAMGDTAGGSLTKLNNAFGDMREELGRAVIREMKGFVDWLGTVAFKLAGVMAAANDLRDALGNQKRGIADTSDALKIAAAAYNETRQRVDELSGGFKTGWRIQELQWEATEKGYKSTTEYRKALEASLPALRMRREGLEGLASREKAQADALAAAAKAAADYAKEVTEAYAKTATGKRKELEESIKGWEKHTEVAGASKEKIVAILDDLIAQYEEQYGAWDKIQAGIADTAARAEALGKAAEAAADKTTASLNDITARAEALGLAAQQAAAEVEFAFKAIDEGAQNSGPILEAIRVQVGALGQAAKDAAEASRVAFLKSFQDTLADAKTVFDSLRSIVDQYFTNVNTSIQNTLQVRLNAIEIERAALDAKLDADLKRIDKELKAALKAAGVELKSERDRLADELKAAIASGNAQNIKEAQDALTRYDITEKYEKEKTRLVEEAEKKKTEFEAARAAAEKEFENEKNRIALQQFRANKIMRLIEITINTAVEVSKVLSNPLLAFIVGLAGVVQSALVAAQPEPVFPTYAHGGVVGMDGGGILEGNSGIDTNIIRASAGEYIMPVEQTAANMGLLEAIRSGANAEPNITVTPGLVIVQLDGREIARAQVPYLAEESDKGSFRVNPKAVRAKT